MLYQAELRPDVRGLSITDNPGFARLKRSKNHKNQRLSWVATGRLIVLRTPAMSLNQNEEVAEAIVTRVMQKLGPLNPETTQVVAQEVAAVLGQNPVTSRPQRHQQQAERVVVTANGRNRAGIVVRLATAIDEFAGDIRDISQTIVGEYFTMIIVVDISEATSQGSRFNTFKQRLSQIGDELGIHVVALHDDILAAMHSV